MKKRCEAIFLSHGGGPLPLLGDKAHREMVEALQRISLEIEKPKKIVVVSAHWEADCPSIIGQSELDLLYDYYGFPEESYNIKYPCPGDSVLAAKIHKAFLKAGMESNLVDDRGLDHGVFIPLKIMYPDADIPCVQVSLLKSLDPSAHIELGRALNVIKEEGTLLIGSGFSFHNLKAFFQADTDPTNNANHEFESWLKNICSGDFEESRREEELIKWEQAPGARHCHPREEHLLPLHVCYGYAERACSEYVSLEIMGKKSSMYLW